MTIVLQDKGIPLDKGNRDFERIAVVQEYGKVNQGSGLSYSPSKERCVTPTSSGQATGYEVNYIRRTTYRGQNRHFGESMSYRHKPGANACFICADQGNFAKFSSIWRCLNSGVILMWEMGRLSHKSYECYLLHHTH